MLVQSEFYSPLSSCIRGRQDEGKLSSFSQPTPNWLQSKNTRGMHDVCCVRSLSNRSSLRLMMDAEALTKPQYERESTVAVA